MQSVYLVVKEFGGCFKGKFWCSVLLLLYLEAIYLPVFRKVCFTFVKYRKWIACGLHRFYIPELIRQTQAQTNSGPGIVYPAKTIAALYGQGNVEVFGTANADTRCVAMSLSALVYNFRDPITCSADLVQIMNVGNNMYSALSQSCKQGLLLLTDLPVMVNLSDINYQLTYSESYSGLLNSSPPIISDFPYVTSLLAALILCSWIIIMHLF